MNEEIIDIERERMMAAFQTIDKNKDGFLTFNELKYALMYKNEDVDVKQVEDFIQEADTNGDGKIDYEGRGT